MSEFRFEISESQRKLIAQVRQVVQTEFKPRSLSFMDGEFPWQNIRRLAELDVLGVAVPEAYGGRELSVFDTALVLEEIAKGCYVTAMAVLGEVGSQTRIIATYGSERLKQRLLPGVVRGEHILSICMTEPHAGTDVGAYKTNVVKRDGKLVLNGEKSLVSRAEEASAFVVFARIDGQEGRDGIGCVLVDRGSPGLVHANRSHTMGGEYLHTLRELRVAPSESPSRSREPEKAPFSVQYAAMP